MFETNTEISEELLEAALKIHSNQIMALIDRIMMKNSAVCMVTVHVSTRTMVQREFGLSLSDVVNIRSIQAIYLTILHFMHTSGKAGWR